MTKLRYLLEYFPVVVLDAVFRALPRRVAIICGERLGTFLSRFIPKRRRLVFENLKMAFPEKPEAWRTDVAKEVWRNLGRVAIEFIRLSEITKENYHSFYSVQGGDLFQEAMEKGKGTILVGFHFTNWELTGVGGRFLSDRLVAIARPMKNPYVEKWVQRKRSRAGGMEIILHRQAVKASLKALKSNHAVGILVDQNLYTGGEFVDFFGRPAATTTLPALLHSRTNSPLLILYCLRESGKIKLIFEKVSPPPQHDNSNFIKELTQHLSTRLEDIIRGHPQNWFWVHNRWKRKPNQST